MAGCEQAIAQNIQPPYLPPSKQNKTKTNGTKQPKQNNNKKYRRKCKETDPQNSCFSAQLELTWQKSEHFSDTVKNPFSLEHLNSLALFMKSASWS